MNEEKPIVAIHGPTLLSDLELAEELAREFVVARCEQRKELWRTLREKHVNVVLLEIGPDGTELELLRHLQKEWPGVPVIAVGKGEPKELIVRAFKYGVRDFFKIPYNVELLVERARAMAKAFGKQKS